MNVRGLVFGLTAAVGLSVVAGTVQVREYAAAPQASGAVAVREIRSAEPVPSEGSAPAAFSVVPPLSWPSPGYDVEWFRFNLLIGSHRSVRGFDIGVLGNMSRCTADGLGLAGLFNIEAQSRCAFHLAGLFNYCEWDFAGVQLAAGLSRADGNMSGFQLAAATVCGRLEGLQLGVFNYAEQGAGVQLGLVNCSERLTGLQLGLLNINLDSAVPVLPILSFGF